MAISVDTVYQRVLTLANKEQRGYITPQEFNLLANQAQMQIFESYFYAKNLRDRREPNRENVVDETNLTEMLDTKLNPFRSVADLTASGNSGDSVLDLMPTTATISGVTRTVYQTGRLFYGPTAATRYPIQKVPLEEARRFFDTGAIRHRGLGDSMAVYTDSTIAGSDVLIYGSGSTLATGNASAEVFVVPLDVNWTYVVVNGKALYNASDTSGQDFELHESEEDTVVNLILALAGIVMNKIDLTQLATSVAAAETNIQNQ